MIIIIAFGILIILAVISVAIQIKNHLRDKSLFENHIPESKNWAKIQYFNGKQTTAGRTKLRLSDGRIFDAWGGLISIKFEQADKTRTGEYRRDIIGDNSEAIIRDALIIDKNILNITIDRNERILIMNGQKYITQVDNLLLSDKTYKEGKLLCARKELSPHYTEVIFTGDEVDSEELLVVSLMIMKERLVPGV